MLRTVIMFFIVLFHSIIHGMVVTETNAVIDLTSVEGLTRSFVLQTILLVTSVSVNCFVLISGYFMVKKQLKISRLTSIWLAAVFYGIIIWIIGSQDSFYEMSIPVFVEQIFPVQFDNYWFITQYMGLMLLSPFLNKMISAFNQRTYQLFLLVMGFLTLSFFQSGDAAFPYGFQYKLNGGFSLLWFVYVYFVGAYIRLYQPFQHYRHFGKLFMVSALIFAAYMNVSSLISQIIYDIPHKMGELTYNGFTFILSCQLFFWALRLNEKCSSFVGCLAKCSPFVFGVYLIHDNFYLRDKIWHQWMHFNSIESLPVLLMHLIVISVSIFLVCLVLEAIRQRMFGWLSIDRRFAAFVEKIVDKGMALCNRMFV